MDASRALIFICIFFLLGISLGTFNILPLFFVILILSVIGALVLNQKKLAMGLVLALSAGFLIGVVQFNKISDLREMNGKIIHETVLIVEQLSAGTVNRYLVRGEFLEYEIVSKSLLSIGEQVSLEGKLQTDEEPWDRYGYSKGEVGTIFFPKLVDTAEPPAVPGYFERLRNTIEMTYRKNLSPDSAGFAAGLFLGEKKELSSELNNALLRTGTIHIIVLSGYNITILIAFISKLFRFIRLRIRMLLTLSVITLFLFLVGFSPSIVRAAIMGGVLVIEPLAGRKREQLSVLVATATLMSLMSPLSLTSDPGFQLSFLATLGIILFEERLSHLFKGIPTMFRESLSTSVAAQVLVLPAIAYYFGSLSLLSPVINMLVLPTIPLAMSLSAILILASLAPWLSIILSGAAELALNIPITLIESASKISPMLTLSTTNALLICLALTFMMSQIKIKEEKENA